MKLLFTFLLVLVSLTSSAKSVRNLRRPQDSGIALQLLTPTSQHIFQRHGNEGLVFIKGVFSGGKATQIEARVINEREVFIDWKSLLKPQIGVGEFQGYLTVPQGGWYELQVRLSSEDSVSQVVTCSIGVGDVFLIAGQSNAGNWGSHKTSPTDGQVVAWDGQHWALASDPQPLAMSDGSVLGSPWPSFGDALRPLTQVPIGIVSVPWGGTAVESWLPNSNDQRQLFLRIKNVLAQFENWGGVRAILWHQGEADTYASTPSETYETRLKQVIMATFRETSFPIVWFVAEASYYPTLFMKEKYLAAGEAIVAAQRRVVDGKRVFKGAATDDLTGLRYRKYDFIHMNATGLEIHGKRWAEAVNAVIK